MLPLKYSSHAKLTFDLVITGENLLTYETDAGV